MKLEPIITSLLDTDLYKFNMDQVIFHKHTDLNGEYYFKCRNENIVFTPEMLEEINDQIDYLCSLRFHKDELDYLHPLHQERLCGVPSAVASHPGVCPHRSFRQRRAAADGEGPHVLRHAI